MSDIKNVVNCVIPEFEARELPENEAVRFAQKLGAGWNLGNTFDAFNDAKPFTEPDMETAWVKYRTTEVLFDAVKAAGFKTIRIPVSWHSHLDGALKIDPVWMERVREVVDWALERDLYVILNTHHDIKKGLCYPSEEYADVSERYLRAVWSQIAERFSDCDERLMFEGMNEPRLSGTPYEWNYDINIPDYRAGSACINRMEQVFVDTVRAAGGSNANRYLIVTGYAGTPIFGAGDDMVLPADTATDRLMVEVHSYMPFDFALQKDGGSVFSVTNEEQTSDIRGRLTDVYRRFISKGIPAVLDEFGAVNRNNPADRTACISYISKYAKSCGIPLCIWDNSYEAPGDGDEAFGLFSRATAENLHPEITEAVITPWRS